MGGSEKVEITEDEKAMADIARESYDMFLATGVPVQNEYIRRSTGLTQDEGGNWMIDPDGPLNQDGSTRVDTTDAKVATEKAYGETLAKVNPNRMATVEAVNNESANDGGRLQADMGLAQQSNTLQGLANVARMGHGQKVEATQMQSQLAGEAQQGATESAFAADQKNAVTGYIGSQVGGAAVGVGLKRGGYLDAAKDAPRLSRYVDGFGP